MKNKVFLLVLAVCISICFITCTTFQASGMQMGMSIAGTENLGNFSTKVWINKFLGQSGGPNLFNLSSNAANGPIQDAINWEIRKRGGTAAINLSVKYRTHILHWVLNYVTGNIWAPATVIISGTVIRQGQQNN